MFRVTACVGSPLCSSSALAPALSACRVAVVSLTQPSVYHLKRQGWEMHAPRTDCVVSLLLRKEGRLNQFPWANEWAKHFPECLECLRCLHCPGCLESPGCQERLSCAECLECLGRALRQGSSQSLESEGQIARAPTLSKVTRVSRLSRVPWMFHCLRGPSVT